LSDSNGFFIGTRFQERNRRAFIWELARFFDAIDGRRYAVLRRLDEPSDLKTLALAGLKDGGPFRRLAEPVADAAE
jgi:hypothetical protein